MVTVAAVQASPVWMDAAATAAKTVTLINEAAGHGVSLVAFGESWLPGHPWPAFQDARGASLRDYLDAYRASAVALEGPEVRQIRDAAAASGIHVVFGMTERFGDELFLAQLQIDASGNIAEHRRRSSLTTLERQVWQTGPASTPAVVGTATGRVAALGSAENLTRDLQYGLARSGEQVHVAMWPAFCLSENAISRTTALPNARHYAIENHCYVLMATQVLTADVLQHATLNRDGSRTVIEPGGGAAAIFDPDGNRLGETLSDISEGLAIADLDLSLVPNKARPHSVAASHATRNRRQDVIPRGW